MSTFVSGCVLGSLYLLVRYASRVYSRFRLPNSDVITGRFMGDETVAVSETADGAPGETRDLTKLISREQQVLAQMSDD